MPARNRAAALRKPNHKISISTSEWSSWQPVNEALNEALNEENDQILGGRDEGT